MSNNPCSLNAVGVSFSGELLEMFVQYDKNPVLIFILRNKFINSNVPTHPERIL